MAEDLSRLDPELQEAYRNLQRQGPSSHEDFKRSRAEYAALVERTPVPAGVTVIPTDEHGIKGLLYVPTAAPKGDGKRAAVVWYHSGGFCTGRPELFPNFYNAAVLDLGIAIFAPAYRLAPENPYPAGFNDCAAAWNWFATEGARLYGCDPSKLLVGGISAGGALAFSVALQNRDQGGPPIAGLLLEIPVMSRKIEGSMLNVHFNKVWSRASAEASERFYTPPGTNDPHHYAWPDEHEFLDGLPPTYIAVAENDVLRDGALGMANRLLNENKQGGVEVHLWKGAFHGSQIFVPGARVSKAAVEGLLCFIERIVGGGQRRLKAKI